MAISREPYEITTFKVVQTKSNEFQVEETFKQDLEFEGDASDFYAQVVSMKYFLMTTMPLDQELFKASPKVAIYKAGDHKLTFSETFPKHHFGYTGPNYL